MLNRPSLVEQLIRLGPFKARDANPLGGRLVTANQINAVRDYILELESRALANETPKR